MRPAVLAAFAVLALAGCSSGRPAPAPSTSGAVPVPTSGPVTITAAPPPPSSSSHGPVREVTRSCPYIGTQDLADRVGSRVGRTTVITTSPVGCRFYLPFADFHAVAEITARHYPDATTAHNQMIRTAGRGTQLIGVPHLGGGAEGVLFRTTFYKPDGDRDWACVFRVGTTVFVVKTDQDDTSYNAQSISRRIAER